MDSAKSFLIQTGYITYLAGSKSQINGDLRIKFLDVTCQEGKTETTALNAYDHIVTGMASLSNNNYIVGYLSINNRLIITSTVAHTVRVYYINIPKLQNNKITI